MRSFETAVAQYPSTSVATHTATTNRRTSFASRRTEETIASDEGTIVTDDKTTNGVPHLDGTARRRTSVASRDDAPPLRHKNTKRNETAFRTSTERRNDAPPLRHDEVYEQTKRTNETAFAPPLQRHEHDLHNTITKATNNDDDC